MKNQFNTGDLITAKVADLPFIYHSGIVVKFGELVAVYHNSPGTVNNQGGNVVFEPLHEWLNGREIIAIQPTYLTADYIREQSEKLADKKFNVFGFNCEHYVYLLRDNYAQSPQLYWFAFVLLLVALFFLLR